MRLARASIALAAAALSAQAHAATIVLLDGTSTPRIYDVFTDASGNFFNAFGVFGIAGDYQADVFADKGLGAHVTNFPSSFGISGALPAFAAPPTVNLGALNGAAQDGTDASGVAPPSGALGIRGWLSGIYSKLAGTLTVSWSGQSVAVSNFPATQPVSAAALPLPAGAATAALQPALNGDGGALAHVMNWPVSQAVTGTFWQATQPVSLASLPAFAATPTVNLGTLNGAAIAANQPTNAAQGSTTSGQTGRLTMGAVTTAAPAYTNGQTSPLSLDSAGNLRVNAQISNTPNIDTAVGSTLYNLLVSGTGTFGSAAPTAGVALGAKNGANLQALTASANGLQVETTPKTGAFTIAGCTVGTSSAQCLAAGTYNHVQIQNTSASASVACSWGGTAVLNSSGSIQLAAGQPALWGPNTAGSPSGVALNCIASAASTPLYVESN